jgi:sugar/nucleoside kinase (ribokinase family)
VVERRRGRQRGHRVRASRRRRAPGRARAHVCGHALLEGAQRDAALAFVAEVARRGVPVSLDLCFPLVEAWGASLAEVLPAFDVVFTNEPELMRLAGARRETGGGARGDVGTRGDVGPDRGGEASLEGDVDLDAAAGRVRGFGARTLVVKRGARGATVFAPARADVAPFPVVALDTTAAGDAFVAGFLWALSRGDALCMAARAGNAAGALTAAASGSGGALPAGDDVMALLRAQPPS